MSDRWNYQHFVGSGHAQSMKLHGEPLLSHPVAPAAVKLCGPVRDEAAFAGSVTVWGRHRPVQHLEVRWRHSKHSARAPFTALVDIRSRMWMDASGMEIDRLETLHGAGYVRRHLDDPSEPPTLNGSDAALIERHAVALAAKRISGGVEHLGSWKLRVIDGDAVLLWRSLGHQRQSTMPFSVAMWALDHVPDLIA